MAYQHAAQLLGVLDGQLHPSPHLQGLNIVNISMHKWQYWHRISKTAVTKHPTGSISSQKTDAGCFGLDFFPRTALSRSIHCVEKNPKPRADALNWAPLWAVATKVSPIHSLYLGMLANGWGGTYLCTPSVAESSYGLLWPHTSQQREFHGQKIKTRNNLHQSVTCCPAQGTWDRRGLF